MRMQYKGNLVVLNAFEQDKKKKKHEYKPGICATTKKENKLAIVLDETLICN